MKQYNDLAFKNKNHVGHMVYKYLSLFPLDSDEFSNSGQGNVIRFYAVQAVSAKAMRKAINNLPNTFGENIKKVEKHCTMLTNARKTWAREFLRSNYLFLF